MITTADQHLRAFLASMPGVQLFRSDAAAKPDLRAYALPRSHLTAVLAELDHTRAELAAEQARVGAVRALAADMRTWCSPHGLASHYADAVEQALDAPSTPR